MSVTRGALPQPRAFYAEPMRILLVAHYASDKLGGEAVIPLRLMRALQAAGHEVWLVTHDSGREELAGAPGIGDHVVFTPSLPAMRPIFTHGERLPAAPRQAAWAVTQLERQFAMVRVVRGLVAQLGIDVVHQPISVSPSVPSPIRSLPVPFVVGPLNGGMDLPEGFRERDTAFGRIRKAARPVLSAILNQLVRGRLSADAILVANERTVTRLPRAVRRRPTYVVSDVGVDLAELPPPGQVGSEQVGSEQVGSEPAPGGVQICFAGRLVDWKGVDLLLDAFAGAVTEAQEGTGLTLRILGDGPCRDALEAQADRLGLSSHVEFAGWLDRAAVLTRMQDSDIFVLPSLEEAGGAVVLEAMACGLPVVVPDWGGPSYLVDDTCGIRVAPVDRARYVAGLQAGIVRLAGDRPLRERMGNAGRARVEQHFDWQRIAADVLAVYEQLLARDATARP